MDNILRSQQQGEAMGKTNTTKKCFSYEKYITLTSIRVAGEISLQLLQRFEACFQNRTLLIILQDKPARKRLVFLL